MSIKGSDIERIRKYLMGQPVTGCPDMDQADGIILLKEIDRLNKLLRKGGRKRKSYLA